jgi:hypothetical protein
MSIEGEGKREIIEMRETEQIEERERERERECLD